MLDTLTQVTIVVDKKNVQLLGRGIFGSGLQRQISVKNDEESLERSRAESPPGVASSSLLPPMFDPARRRLLRREEASVEPCTFSDGCWRLLGDLRRPVDTLEEVAFDVPESFDDFRV